MDKYKNAARDVLTPKVGYGLADELKRAGLWVGTISNRPQAADVASRDRMVDVIDRRKAECLVLVSDDSDFVEAKLRCLKTVVVGDADDETGVDRTNNPEVERKLNGFEDMFDGTDDGNRNSCDYLRKENSCAWWELDTESDADPSELQY
ncbi:hypothetical protein V6N13_122369 [Hibiscus sabdariffa]|uniref:NYN domain-containing protein n=1 Tax=Hibiscus sabdariffa TaxID=183260 RepID=A0ABR2Q806_9ROSI